ncbi:flavodoxin family protein [Achromobacter sp. LC458]|uniref:NAD(P)H-dependent oxidoreductase n=1 Tax=unclassified Achromobacter TaxID=2626865 RepID=UPI00062A0CCB|nr:MULTISPECIES: flavodoxin [unclassified Achromobacter]QYJ22867.1 flavodoxin family protein [Achromobacter sp. ES-001]TRM54776.1 flavodoxin family protein [Achromobacter sp. LC458]
MKQLLIAWHSRTGAARQMAEAAARGAAAAATQLDQAGELHIEMRRAADVDADVILASHGFLFCAPENLASLSGEMKECFDRNYYAVLDRIQGRPYACAISAGSDGTGAARQVERICTGWRLKPVAPALIVNLGAQSAQQILADKVVPQADLDRCEDLGGLLAALVLTGG